MNLTTLDIALPIGPGVVFGVWPYSQFIKPDPQNAMNRALADAIKGACGLAIITLGYKFILPA